MRLDKFLKVSRLIKRRTVANEACDAGRVMVNGKPAKASAQIKPGDVIEIQFGTRNVKAEVLNCRIPQRKTRLRNCSDTCSNNSAIWRNNFGYPLIYLKTEWEEYRWKNSGSQRRTN